MKSFKLRTILGYVVMFLGMSVLFTTSQTLSSFTPITERMVVDVTKTPFEDNNGTNLMCYPLVNDSTQVAVGWSKKPSEATGSIEIPKQVKDSSNASYTVKAIVKSGFRYCDFTSITFASDSEVEEIQSEAFYSCQKITTFALPKMCVYGINSSAFMDCRKLETINTDAVATYVNSKVASWDSITEAEKTWLDEHRFDIGDHAFSSCVKLKGITFPANLRNIHESAFHKCINIYGLFFPARLQYNEADYMCDISFDKYAFADCDNLAIIHMQKNVTYIDQFAFTECNKLRIYYEGSAADLAALHLPSEFNKKHVATNKTDATNDYVPIVFNVSAMEMDEINYPGLVYIKQNNNPIMYNGKNNSTKALVQNPGEYLTIFQFHTPTVATSYYNAETHVITIPDTIKGVTVKVIQENAFYDQNGENDDLYGIKFNANLVQIEKNAFKGCTSFKTIDFSNCVALQEIGHDVFKNNESFTGTLTLPNCLKFIGNNAFQNLKKATGLVLFNPNVIPDLRIIGNNAFENFGSEATSGVGELDLLLPYSLNQKDVKDYAPEGYNGTYFNSVGAKAFLNCKLIRTVTLKAHPTAPTKGDQFISFGDYAFSGCSNLLSFKSNKAICGIGNAIFEKCPLMKELFLSTYLTRTKSQLNYKDGGFVWGENEGRSFFFDTNGAKSDDGAVPYRDLVIYIDGSMLPDRRINQEKYLVWNSDAVTYQDEYATSDNPNVYVPYQNVGSNNSYYMKDTKASRPTITTYYNIDYHTAGTIKYINVASGTVGNDPDYTNSVAAIKVKGSSNYTLTRCYATGKTEIDMSGWTVGGANIDTIGPCAFATRSGTNSSSPKNTASKIVLPTSITTIRERAFFSELPDGIDNITYKNGGNEVVDTGEGKKDNCCFLPSSVTKIERFAFFNNDFQKVALPANLSFIGNTAFNVSPGKASAIVDFGIVSGGSSSTFTYSNGGMYDTATKTLLYHIEGTNTALDLSTTTVDGGTIKAIGPRALANSKYSSIKLATTTTMIYGGAFQSSSNLTTVTNFSGLKYIGASPVPSDVSTDMYYNYNAHFDSSDLAAKDASKDNNNGKTITEPITTYIHDDPIIQNQTYNYANRNQFYNWYTKYGSFARCANLEKFDFTLANSSLKKIGYGAFESCSKLETMTNGTTEYEYIHYYDGLTKSNVGSVPDNKKEKVTKGVLDLSGATGLTSIGQGAFRGCSKLKYAHLPMLYDVDQNINNQASLYIGIDYDDKGSWYTRKPNATLNDNNVFAGTLASSTGGAVLVGESAQYMSKDYGSNYYNPPAPSNRHVIGDEVDPWDTTKYDISRAPSYVFPNTTYYYVKSTSSSYEAGDLSTKTDDIAVKYWIYVGGESSTHKYVLFESQKQLNAYFA